jgi:hypothetical protein
MSYGPILPAFADMRRGAVVLSDSVTAILSLAAAHDGVTPSQLVTRLVCQHADRVGLPALADAAGDLHDVPRFARANRFNHRRQDHA